MPPAGVLPARPLLPGGAPGPAQPRRELRSPELCPYLTPEHDRIRPIPAAPLTCLLVPGLVSTRGTSGAFALDGRLSRPKTPHGEMASTFGSNERGAQAQWLIVIEHAPVDWSLLLLMIYYRYIRFWYLWYLSS